jgi:hypothetical protein
MLEVDAGFTCILSWSRRVVKKDELGLYIDCKCGQHFLDGQLDDEGRNYVGVRLADEPRRVVSHGTDRAGGGGVSVQPRRAKNGAAAREG